MTNHLNRCTHMMFEQDQDILTRKLFDVNIRLARVNPEYAKIVRSCVDYIEKQCTIECKGYKKPHGFSGANAGIPFNIIAYMHGGLARPMINPRIITASFAVKKVKSNCGSLTLDNSIEILRSEFITVEYYGYDFEFNLANFGPTPGFTIQHEIEHNQGILILDKE